MIAACILCPAISAQDIITLNNGDEITAKVIKISDTEIEYKQWSNQEGPIYAKSLEDIFMVKFENGEKKIFDSRRQDTQNVASKPTSVYGNDPMYRQGRNLYIGSRKLFMSDVNSLFGYNRADSYSTGRSEILWGTVLIPSGAAMAIAGGVLAIVFEFEEMLGLWIPLLATGVVSSVTGGILLGTGFSTLNGLTEEYNNVILKPQSLSFYPSLMRVPTLGIATGIGMALRF